MSEGWAWLISGLSAVSLVLSIANTLWSWTSKGAARLSAKQREQDTMIADHRDRLIKIEGLIPHLPSKDDLLKMQVTMAEVTTKLDNFAEDVRRVERGLERFERAILKEG